MKTIDKITQRIKKLPENSQKEVLLFVEFLLSKSGVFEEGMDIQSWNKFSLDQAMHGLEKDDLPEYYESDLKEKYAK
jgi:hypothetical protein